MHHGMQSYGRGVWIAPWMGPNGETILVALNRHEHQIGEQIMIPLGGNHLAASDELWSRVEKHDPIPKLRVI
jgi:hypothetical protein